MNDKDTNDLSIETSINYLSSKDSNGLSNIFALSGSSSTSVQFSLSERKAAFINEIGVFVVSDDKGTVNGIAPGTEGYMQAALTQSRVIFSSLSEKASAGINFVRQLTFKAGERLGFYLVANNTTTSVDTTSSKTSDNVFFSLSSSNSDKFDHVRVKDNGKSSFDLAWEDLKGGGDKDFNDLVLKMEIVKTPPALGAGLQGQKEGEILDFRSVKGQISANFTVNSDSSNRNHVGFYRINDALGTVTDPLTGKTITPGEVGYAQAAIRQSIVNFNQSSTSSTSIEGGGLFATYIIANGNKEQFLNLNQSNQEGSSPVAYFTYQKANPDKLQHIRQCGDNTFGFEEPEIKGKREYNYTVFKVELSVKADINIDKSNDKGSDDTNSQVGTLAFAAANYSDFEGNSGTVDKVVAKIQRTGSTKGAVSVQVQLDEGSTATPNDYTNKLPFTINFADGETSKDVVIPIVGDTTDEMDETIKLKLFNATGGASLGSQQTATYTIKNDDGVPSINFNDVSLTEGDSGTTNASFTVNLSKASGKTVTVDYATADDTATSGSDYTAIPTTTLTFNPGETSKTIDVAVNGDTINEKDETFFVNLSNASNGIITNNQAKGKINNDDLAPIFDFSAATYSVTEGNTAGFTTNAQVIVNRTNNTAGTDTVVLQLADGATPIATGGATANAGIDYNNSPITVTFNPGDASKTVSILVAGDTTYEQNENVALTLANPSTGSIGTTKPSAVLTINNDDTAPPPPTVSIAASSTKATEPRITSTYTISRAGDTSADLTVNLDIDASSTVKDTDYTLSGGSISGTGTTRSVVIAAGQSSLTVTLTATNDGNAAEADEILKLNLANNSAYNIGSSATGTVTIAANGTEVINTNDSSSDYKKMEGSLRQALINANAFAGLDNITFNIPTTDSGYNAGMYTITLASALDNISDDVNIKGLGANKLTVSGNNAVGVFYINSGKTVNIDGLTIAKGKSASFGGGIYNAGTLTVTNSTLSGNSADDSGGGIYNGGTLTVTNSTVSGNSAFGGGGIYNGGTLTVTNSTVSGNSTFFGGGIYNGGTLTVTNSTLSGNSATNKGGGIFNSNGTVKAKNTIIAKNTATSSDPDFLGTTLTSDGYNLIGVYSGAGTTGDIFGTDADPVDPLLGSLQDNGGSTYTMALLSGSQAIDAGDPDFTSPPNTDQRGNARVYNDIRIDIGAYEFITPVK